MKVISYTSNDILKSKKLFDKIYTFCRRAYLEKERKYEAKVNMDFVQWKTKPHTLLHTIMIQERFRKDNGMICFAFNEKNDIIALAGAYSADFAPKDVLICGVRVYTLKEYRTKTIHFKYVFPEQFNYGRKNGYKQCWMTFNRHNTALKDAIKRGVGLGLDFGEKFQEEFADVEYPEGEYNIKHTPQCLIIKKLDPNYFFDLETIRIKD